MTSTTYAEFDGKTEAIEVAEKFGEQIKGKTIVITGVNKDGLGYAAAHAFASQSPAVLVLAGRNPSKLQECLDALKAEFPAVDYRILKLDLSRQAAVREAAAELLVWSDVPKVDILVNNAAVMNLPELTFTEDGVETQFGTNHVGHYLFTCSIMPKLLKAAAAGGGAPRGATRVVNVSSLSPLHAVMRWSDMRYERKNRDLPASETPPYAMLKMFGSTDPEDKSYLPLEGYNQSKVANVLFGIALSDRLYERHGVLSVAVHPGVIKTELSRYASQETLAALGKIMSNPQFVLKTPAAGAATTLVAATDPKLGRPGSGPAGAQENYGAYLLDCQISDKARASSVSSAEADRLWSVSEELVKEKFSF